MSVPTIIIFGASGDLTSRKLIPALFRLDSTGLLKEECQVVGMARTEHTSEEFRQLVEPKVKEAILASGQSWFAGTWSRFARRLHYVAGDAALPQGVRVLGDWLKNREADPGGDRLYYFAVAPELYTEIAARLGEAGHNREERGFRRVVVEKPFGRDLASAHEVNRQLNEHFSEKQIYRIDHYLGKDTVQNILVFRFGNSMFEPLWNRRYIDHIQITVAEKVTVGKRAGYYDTSGVLRDMFQSHLLQVLSLVAMEPPSQFSADRLRNEKVKVLDSILIPSPGEALASMATGQYTGYHDEKGVPQDSRTPTFAAVRLQVDNWRWKGVPFYLRSGKGMTNRYSEVTIQFREPPFRLFPQRLGHEPEANRITIVLQPDEGIKLSFQTKVPAIEGTELQARDLFFDYKGTYGSLPEAYERLLLDAMQGDASLFMRGDEIERSWEIIDPFVKSLAEANAPKPESYSIGSDGPPSANELLAKKGRVWQKLG